SSLTSRGLAFMRPQSSNSLINHGHIRAAMGLASATAANLSSTLISLVMYRLRANSIPPPPPPHRRGQHFCIFRVSHYAALSAQSRRLRYLVTAADVF